MNSDEWKGRSDDSVTTMFAKYKQPHSGQVLSNLFGSGVVFCMGMGNPWVFCGFSMGMGMRIYTHGKVIHMAMGHRFVLFWNKCCKIDVVCSNHI